MKTQVEIITSYEATIPGEIREKYKHLSYMEMAMQEDCALWAELLEQWEEEWFAAEERQ